MPVAVRTTVQTAMPMAVMTKAAMQSAQRATLIAAHGRIAPLMVPTEQMAPAAASQCDQRNEAQENLFHRLGPLRVSLRMP